MLPPSEGTGSPPATLDILQSMSSTAPLGVTWSLATSNAAALASDPSTRATEPAVRAAQNGGIVALDDSVIMSYAHGVSMVVRADGLATLRVPSGAACDVGTSGLCRCADQTDRDPCPITQARPELRLLHQDAVIVHQLLLGRSVLHGSAVSFGDRGVVVLGAGGAGKSTTAAALCGRGATLLSDDIVAIDHSSGTLRLLRTESRVRLISEQGWRKREVAVATSHTSVDAPAALALVVCLTADEGADSPAWTRLQGLPAFESVRELGAGMRGLAIQGREHFVRGLAAIADEAEVWALRRTRTAPAPEEIAANVHRLLNESAAIH